MGYSQWHLAPMARLSRQQVLTALLNFGGTMVKNLKPEKDTGMGCSELTLALMGSSSPQRVRILQQLCGI